MNEMGWTYSKNGGGEKVHTEFCRGNLRGGGNQFVGPGL